MITSLVIRLDVIQISSAAVGEVQTLSSSFLASWLNSRPSSWRENQDREYTGHIWRCWYTSWPCLLLTFKVCLFDLLGRTLWNFARVQALVCWGRSNVDEQSRERWVSQRSKPVRDLTREMIYSHRLASPSDSRLVRRRLCSCHQRREPARSLEFCSVLNERSSLSTRYARL